MHRRSSFKLYTIIGGGVRYYHTCTVLRHVLCSCSNQKKSIKWSNIILRICLFNTPLGIVRLSRSLSNLNSRITREAAANGVALQHQWRAAKDLGTRARLLNNLAQGDGWEDVSPYPQTF